MYYVYNVSSCLIDGIHMTVIALRANIYTIVLSCFNIVCGNLLRILPKERDREIVRENIVKFLRREGCAVIRRYVIGVQLFDRASTFIVVRARHGEVNAIRAPSKEFSKEFSMITLTYHVLFILIATYTIQLQLDWNMSMLNFSFFYFDYFTYKDSAT